MFGALRVKLLVPAAVLLLLYAACDSPSEPPGGDPPTGPTDPASGPQTGIECQDRGYPCSLSEVPRSILERSDSLGDEAVALLRGGTSTAGVAAWLRQHEDLAELQHDDVTVRFRLEGGRAVWIFRDGALGAAPPAGQAAAAAATRLTVPGRPDLHVVGERSEEKKAFVLSPFHWEFGGTDDAVAVAQILGETRGYEGRVTLVANDDPSNETIGLNSLLGWQQYHVVHMATHGGVICDDETGDCRAAIAVGLLGGAQPGESKGEKLGKITKKGVDTAKVPNGPEYLIVTADFFRQEYENGLDDVLIFINSCNSFGPAATDLVDALQGSNTVIFGWDDRVWESDAFATAVALFELLAVGGYPAEVALSELGGLATGRVNRFGRIPNLRLSRLEGGADLRIRDVVYLLDPRTGSILSESDRIEIDGAMGDGQPDAVPFRVSVDGVKPEFAGGMLVHVSVDGESSDPVPLSSSQYLDDGRWDVEGVVQLSYDVAEERVAMFHARVGLHDGGESEHESAATLIGAEPIMGWKWLFEADYETHLTTFIDGAPSGGVTLQWARAELVLGFREDQDLAEPNPTYLLTEGIVTGDFSSTHTFFLGTCYRNYGPFTFTFEDPPTWVPSFAFLSFHTEFDPVRYSGTMRIFAPILDGTIDCGDGPEPDTYAPHASYMEHVPGEGLTVSEDGWTIRGSWSEDVTTVLNDRAYHVRYHRSTYTITRIE
jgi:hypothetical protein